MRRKIEAVIGVVAFALLFALAALSFTGDGPHLKYGNRHNIAVSDGGLLLTLLIAAPVVIYAAYAHWRRK